MQPAENQTIWQKIAVLCLLLNGCAATESKPTLKINQLIEMPIEQLINLPIKKTEQPKRKN